MQSSPGSERDQREPTAGQPAADPPEAERRSDGDDLALELERLEDRYKRALADLDNYRKRAARESERRVSEAKEHVVRDWLEVVDSVERAMQMQSDGPCVEGLRAVLAQMETVLEREGAERVGAPGDPFDPERHEAIAVQPAADVPDRTVVAVQRSGFALGDRVIRPAQVVVARTPEHAH
jgi:molecular chaperone GrpE